MAQEFRERLTQAVIQEMERALQDPEQEPADHAQARAMTIGIANDGSIEANMSFGDLPTWLQDSHEVEVTPEGITGTISFHTNPHTPTLRFQNHATASITFKDPTTGEHQEQPLTEQQQDILDQYATQAAFQLTGVANGELLEEDPTGNRASLNGQELIKALLDRVEEATLLSRELARRAGLPDPDNYDPPILLSIATQAALTTATINLEILHNEISSEIEESGDHSRWDPPLWENDSQED